MKPIFQRGTAQAAALLCLAAPIVAVAAPVPASPSAPAFVAPAANSFVPPPIVPVNAPQNKLHMTTAQQQKVNAILGGFFQKRTALERNKNQTQAQMQSSYVALEQSIHAQVVNVLTPAQQASLKQFQANRAKYIAAAETARTKAAQYSQQLHTSLTPAQQSKITGIVTAAAAQLKSILSNAKLTIQQKNQQASAVRTSTQGKIKAMLTQPQLAIYANLQHYSEAFESNRRLAILNSV